MTARADGHSPGVFLDRDGTIIEDRGHIRDTSDVVLYKGAVQALGKLQEHFRLFIVTNQTGVAKGEITIEDVDRINSYLTSLLAESGIAIVQTYVCPHARGDGCKCIKPKPWFLNKAAKDHGIDLKRSFAIGDHPHDVELAANAGAKGIYLLCGHGRKHRRELDMKVPIVPGIQQAAELILESGIS